jgi:hypothetical protein
MAPIDPQKRSMEIAQEVRRTDDMLYLYQKELGSLPLDGWQDICIAIQNNQEINRLYIAHNKLGNLHPEAFKMLGDAIKKNGVISWVDLDSNEIRDDQLCAFVAAIAYHGALEELILDDNNLTDDSCSLLLETHKSWPALKRLDFEQNQQMTDTGRRELARSLVGLHSSLDRSSFVQHFLDQ